MKDELGREMILTCDGLWQVDFEEQYAPDDIIFPRSEEGCLEERESAFYNAVADAMVYDMRLDRS